MCAKSIENSSNSLVKFPGALQAAGGDAWANMQPSVKICEAMINNIFGGAKNSLKQIAELQPSRDPAEIKNLYAMLSVHADEDPEWNDPLDNLMQFKTEDQDESLIIARLPDGRPAGYCHVIRDFIQESAGQVFYDIHVAMIYVIPSARNRMIGKAMMCAVAWQAGRDILKASSSTKRADKTVKIVPCVSADPESVGGMRLMEAVSDHLKLIAAGANDLISDKNLKWRVDVDTMEADLSCV